MRVVNESRGVAIAGSVERASTLWARSRGLLGRRGLEPGKGLLLDPCSGIHTFFMAFPIDALFLSGDGTVLHLAPGMGPWRMSRYVLKARSVLELPAGTIRETGTQVGDRLAFEE